MIFLGFTPAPRNCEDVSGCGTEAPSKDVGVQEISEVRRPWFVGE